MIVHLRIQLKKRRFLNFYVNLPGNTGSKMEKLFFCLAEHGIQGLIF